MPGQAIEAVITIKAEKELETPVIGMIIQDKKGIIVFATNTKEMGIKLKTISRGKTIKAVFRIDNVYTNSTYTISCAITDKDRSTIFARVEEAYNFNIAGWSMDHSAVHPEHSFEIKY